MGNDVYRKPPADYDPDEGFEPAILRIELDEEPDKCNHCGGLGTVFDDRPTTLTVRTTCPQCDGRGTPHPVAYFPYYIRYLIAKGLSVTDPAAWPDLPHDSDLLRFPTYELSRRCDDFADRTPEALTRGIDAKSIARRKIYLRLAAIALRHFADDPAGVQRVVELIRMVARTGSNGKSDR